MSPVCYCWTISPFFFRLPAKAGDALWLVNESQIFLGPQPPQGLHTSILRLGDLRQIQETFHLACQKNPFLALSLQHAPSCAISILLLQGIPHYYFAAHRGNRHVRIVPC